MIFSAAELARIVEESRDSRKDGVEALGHGQIVSQRRNEDRVFPEETFPVPCPFPLVFAFRRLDRFLDLLDQVGIKIGDRPHTPPE
jgi:hypothetical protein